MNPKLKPNPKPGPAELAKKVVVNLRQQQLTFYHHNHDPNSALYPLPQAQAEHTFAISTAKNGTGNQAGSGKTPLGQHRIAQKIGQGAPLNAVFVGRVATGEVYNEILAKANPQRDWILTRILWLEGLEAGVNQGNNGLGCCDTYQRYIYIHGTPDTEPMGIPLSHGCIRMRNSDLLWLFDQVDVGTKVEIIEQ